MFYIVIPVGLDYVDTNAPIEQEKASFKLKTYSSCTKPFIRSIQIFKAFCDHSFGVERRSTEWEANGTNELKKGGGES